MLKREIKRVKLAVERVLEPFGLLVLAFLFVLPVLTVLNLDTVSENKPVNVLGVQDEPGLGIALVGGIHEVFEDESLSFITDTTAKYSTTLRKRDKGEYSKPVLQITNKSSKDAKVTVSGYTQLSTGSDIYIIVNNEKNILQTKNGKSIDVSFTLDGTETIDMYILVDSTKTVLFDEEFEIRVW
jgi:hypothetical protein